MTSQAELRAIFDSYDTNGDGEITKQEMIQVFIQLNDGEEKLSDSEIINAVDQFFEDFDVNQDGKITWEELSQFQLPQNSSDLLSELRTVFDSYDVNGDGAISRDEMVQVLTDLNVMSVEQIEKAVEDFFQDFDVNSDGKVTWEELTQFDFPN
eukprot:TRINITY_DN13605_c0_g1_i1.p1 TRINITY_DN13605_c0_g1~~TRINITY_DN13605_c0_g1_i1.p1  ORF type:complete len:153 (+),score=45.51 TRINITY_DN13605_c0_g1_i1:127-585(+)